LQTLPKIGLAVAQRRKSLGLKQADVAALAGVAAESLSRFERGRSAEFGTRKLLAVLSVLGAELDVTDTVQAGNLDSLRQERAAVTFPGSAAKPSVESSEPASHHLC
jgi:HTH-type transcriptional regulator/antitoxin HipB